MAGPNGNDQVTLSVLESQRAELDRKIGVGRYVNGAIEYLKKVDVTGLNAADKKRLTRAQDDLQGILQRMGIVATPTDQTNGVSPRARTSSRVNKSRKSRKTEAHPQRRYMVEAAILQPLRAFLGRDDLPDTLAEFVSQVFGEDWVDAPVLTSRGRQAETVRLEEDIAKGAESRFGKKLRANVTKVLNFQNGNGVPEGYVASDQMRGLYSIAKKRSAKSYEAKLKQWGI